MKEFMGWHVYKQSSGIRQMKFHGLEKSGLVFNVLEDIKQQEEIE
jgi:hypothetical protein